MTGTRIRFMATFARTLVTLSCAALVSGCITSKDALFDSSKAVLPLSGGKYEVQLYSSGRWTRSQAGSMETRDNSYLWKKDGQDPGTAFSLYLAGDNSFVIVETGGGNIGAYRYGLLRRARDGWLLYVPRCDELFRLKDFEEFQLDRIEKGECLYANAQRLTQDLIKFADGAGKWMRLTASK
jgi:hypothetical protein